MSCVPPSRRGSQAGQQQQLTAELAALRLAMEDLQAQGGAQAAHSEERLHDMARSHQAEVCLRSMFCIYIVFFKILR